MAWVAIVASLAGAAMQSQAAKEAAKTSAGSAAGANAAQLAMYQQNRADQAPYRTVGTSALEALAGGGGLRTPSLTGVTRDTQAQLVDTTGGAPAYNPQLYATSDAYRKAWDEVARIHREGFNSDYTAGSDPRWIEAQVRMRLPEAEAEAEAEAQGSGGALGGLVNGTAKNPLTRAFTLEDLQNDPVYQAAYQSGLDMGNKQLTTALGAAGTSQSGGAAKALARYASDYTAQKGNDAFNRFQVTQGVPRNFLSSLAGIGQQATNQVQGAGMNYANNASNIMMQAGQNAGAAQLAQGNIWGGAVQGIGNWWQNQSTLDKILAARGGGQQPQATNNTYTNGYDV